jgi:hypothetical protein
MVASPSREGNAGHQKESGETTEGRGYFAAVARETSRQTPSLVLRA